jgi:creatinine amidohydrolase
MTLFQRMPDECRMEYLSPSEWAARLHAKPVLYWPLGSLEWHNEHLPIGTDSMLALAFAVRLCRELGGVVLPAFHWNTGQCHDSPCTCHVPEDLYRPTLINVCMGLRSFPAKVLVIVNAHGGKCQREAPQAVADQLNAGGYPFHVIEAYPYTERTTAHAHVDHANTGETSVAMEMIPEVVRLDRPVTPDICTGEVPFQERGTPTAQRGRRVWDAYLQEAEHAIAQALA